MEDIAVQHRGGRVGKICPYGNGIYGPNIPTLPTHPVPKEVVSFE
jgi:hypothetical protein